MYIAKQPVQHNRAKTLNPAAVDCSAPFNMLYCHNRVACVLIARPFVERWLFFFLRRSGVSERLRNADQPARQGMTIIFRQTRESGNPSEGNGQGDPRFGKALRSGRSATPPEIGRQCMGKQDLVQSSRACGAERLVGLL